MIEVNYNEYKETLAENMKLIVENGRLKQEIERLNNIINEIEKDIKNLYTYGIKNNAEQKDYLLNRLQELKGSDKE